MRIQSHLIYLSLITVVAAAWLYERAEDSELPPSPSAQHRQPTLLNAPETLEASPAVTLESAEQTQSEETDILTEAKAASSSDTTEISNSAQMQKLVTKRIADTETRFEREDYHRDWSFESRQLISDLFIVHAKELENFNVTDIECKRSMCRIQSEIAGEQFMQIMELQRLLNEQSWFGSSGETVFSANDNNQPHEIYLSFEK